MTITKLPLVAAACGVLALGACTDPATLTDPNNPNAKRNQGLAAGAIIGAGIGALTSDNKGKGALIGAAAGAAAGGLIGNQLDKQAAEMRAQLANDAIGIQNTGDRLIVTLPQDITFDTDSVVVRPSLRSDLARVADNLLRYPNSSIQVIGHTDNVGDAGYNQGLSVRRANAVGDILSTGGVSYNRIQTLGRGEDAPIASNLTPEGRARNRRVEIVVIPTNV